MMNLSLPAPAKIPLPSLASSSTRPPPKLPYQPPPPSPSIRSTINFEPLRDRLIKHLDAGHLHKAISTLDVMARQNTHPDLITYSVLLKACIRSRDFQLGKLVHSHLTQSKLELDSVLFNSLISLYSKSGNWNKAREIFQSMGNKRDLVSWSAMISCFANNKMEFEAILTFLDMLENGFFPNEYCFTAVIRACSTSEFYSVGEIILGFLMKTGYLDFDTNVGCALIDMFAKGNSDLESALKVFDKMPERNVVSWTLMMTRCTQLGYPKGAIELFVDMILSGYMADRFTLSGVVSACTELESESLSLGKQLHSWVILSGSASDVCIGCSLVDMYAKCTMDGSLDDSRRVFDRMEKHNVMSWTAIITGYVQCGGHDMEAIDLFCKMIEGPVSPNHFTFSSVLKACGNLSDYRTGEQFYSQAVKHGFSSDDCVGNSLISMYARSGRMDDAQKAFESLFEKNLVSYNTIVDTYAKNLDSEGAFELFHEIADAGVEVNAFTFTSLLSGASNIGAIGKGEQIHARLLKSGFQSNQCVCNALISMYARCGHIEAAFQVFNEMGDRNVISWTSMITGFAKHGFATRALEMFHEMLEARIRPNEITYIAVLSACSHAGLVSEGWEIFNSMHEEHKIAPRMEHYACMVDLLGRSGSLREAIEFIDTMPCTPDALIWRTFLGACRVHHDKELGEHAAKMILQQDPQDTAAHILLSNLYASSGQWDDVARIRKNMKERNLIKEAGCSWIEADNKIHRFHVADTSHPQAQEIYEKLDEVALEIKGLGYFPDTDFVLHELEEEQKEQYVFQHSEKIAVAFGLISTSRSKLIRVFKNLRVCGDCHTAIKYISMATGREIVLRDSNRFHHIKNGTCSCNDYW
ncbi:Pentatricopeptide repeat-containing protein [Hibiscus syriacus]|uniref:Pentatricopeptide repeat-containing protein n=1 Tax=Hibiscus syriacus TaxID=106335 RepID=A0A6A2WNL8_HIBSY|nr:pentatricopeptide repeat-containing protein At3g49170, chloroplastic-like [Hibiscus syriacus]KAE8662172.1 Pentatricopeptide repeat-containing protein [Hibiscus syriacus]